MSLVSNLTIPVKQTYAQTGCDPNSEQLSIGSRDDKVTELQTDLTTLGYGDLLGPPGIDGIFGPFTKAAVTKFQQDNGLIADGIAGPKTWGAICSALNSTPPTPTETPTPTPIPPTPTETPTPTPTPNTNVSEPIPRKDIPLEPLKELPRLSEEEQQKLTRDMENIDISQPALPTTSSEIPGPASGSQTKEGRDLTINNTSGETTTANITTTGTQASYQILPVSTTQYYRKIAGEVGNGFLQQNFKVYANQYVGQHASVIAEPSVATDGKRIFYTTNFFAANSSDGGKSWTYFDLSKDWGLYPGTTQQQFCCDQDVIYDPQHKIFIWYAQAWNSPLTGENYVRILVSNDPSLPNNWWSYDIKPTSIGPSFKGHWFDYPQLALSKNFLYITTNVFQDKHFTGSLILRISTNFLATKSDDISAAVKTKFEPDQFTVTPVQGAEFTMYFANHLSNQQMRIYTWKDFADSPTSKDIKIPPWSFAGKGDMSCPSPDGNDICKRADSRILGGWIRNGIIGFLWNVAQGNGFPFPYVDSSAFKIDPISNDITYESSPLIWSDKHAVIYGYAAPDITGLGIVAYWSGGGIFPQLRAAIAGIPVTEFGTFRVNYSPTSMDLIASSMNAPTSNEWGDYFRIRSCSGAGFSGYVISGVTQIGTKISGAGGPSESIFPSFYVIGNPLPAGFTGPTPCGLPVITTGSSGITSSEPSTASTANATGATPTPSEAPSPAENATGPASAANATNDHPPIANDVSTLTNADTPVTVTFSGSDEDNNSLTASIVSPPLHGSLGDIDQTSGTVTYTPEIGFTGTDSFTYKLNDGTLDSNPAIVTVNVNSSATPPESTPNGNESSITSPAQPEQQPPEAAVENVTGSAPPVEQQQEQALSNNTATNETSAAPTEAPAVPTEQPPPSDNSTVPTTNETIATPTEQPSPPVETTPSTEAPDPNAQ